MASAAAAAVAVASRCASATGLGGIPRVPCDPNAEFGSDASAEWETFAQAAYQKEPECGFPSYVSQPLVAPDFDRGSECWCKKRTGDLLLPLLPPSQNQAPAAIFFFFEGELQNIHQLFLHVGASRTDKKLLCQDWNRELLYT